jgi:anti-anti-sigma factor
MIEAAMVTLTRLFQWEVEGDTLILTARIDLNEKEHRQIEQAKQDILTFLARTPTKNIIMDFRNTNFFWTTAFNMFIQVWKEVRRRAGRLLFCNVSQQERKLLHYPKLDHLWPICSSREKAVTAVHRAPSAYQVQKTGLKGQSCTTIYRAPEAKAREVFHRQRRLDSIGRLRLLDAQGQVIEERTVTPSFNGN